MRRTSMFALTLTLAACGAEPTAPPAPPAAPVCTYTADTTAVAVSWKAFKFTEKTGVGGGFGTIAVQGSKAAATAPDALNGLRFEIPVATVDSKNPERDKKIAEQLFGTMTATAAITGDLSLTGPAAGTLSVTMNGATHPVPVQLVVGEGDIVTLTGALDLTTWGAADAVAALNKVCEDVHKGADGVSKLWPDVEISATVPVKKVCAPAR